MLRLVAILALAVPLLAPSASRAQATDQGADEIIAALADWASSITGEKFTPAQLAAEITMRPQLDHYVASLPLGPGPDAPNFTADVNEAVGRWVIDNINLPESAVFKNQNGGNRLELRIDSQFSAAFIDDTVATASQGNFALAGVGLHFHTDDGSGGTLIKADRVLQSAIVRPLFDSDTNVALDTAAEGLSLQVEQVNKPPVKLDFDRLRTSVALDGTSRVGTAKLLQSLANRDMARSGAAAKLPPGSAAEAFAGFMSGMTIGATVDGLSLDTGDTAGSIHTGQVILDVAQQAGLVQGGLRIEAETLAYADPRVGPFAQYIPTRFSLHQSIANVPVAALIHLAALDDSGATAKPDDIQRLFAAGGMQIGLEDFQLDIAGASFTATGQGALTAPTEGTATGTITATNLDQLQQRLTADPVLAKGVALLIFLKGVGRTVDDHIVWDIAYRDRQLTVNKQNLSAMLQAFTGR